MRTPSRSNTLAQLQVEREWVQLEGDSESFAPFILETFCGMDKKASAFIKGVLKDTQELQASLDLDDVVYALGRAPAVAVVRGNAECVMACLARSRD